MVVHTQSRLERQTGKCRISSQWGNRGKAFSVLHMFILTRRNIAKYLRKITLEEKKQLGTHQKRMQRYIQI